VIDGLARRGVEVVHSGIEDVHATGHAKQEELKTLLGLFQPEWFVPVHGEYRHLVAHARLAQAMGIPAERVIVCEDGDQITLDDADVHRSGRVSADYLYVDGLLDDVGHALLRDRRTLADEGVVVVFATIDAARRKLLTAPQIITRGWVYAPEAEPLVTECADTVANALTDALSTATEIDLDALQRTARHATGQFVSSRTGRRPMIVPVVIEV
ncbi:MAG: ribonuclease J, partial [Acidimicrobiia bacterium]